MKLDLFSTPIWIGNIESEKVKIQPEETLPSWQSKVESTYGKPNNIDDQSLEYLLKTIVSIIDDTIISRYSINLNYIWENFYTKGDFQEKHIHPNNDLSFIIYKKVKESKTVFFNPAEKLIQCFYEKCIRKTKLFGNQFVDIKCRQDQIVIFPSHVEHMVRKSDDDAITIAGNLSLTFHD